MPEEKTLSNPPATVSNFDRLVGGLTGLPDVVNTPPTTVRAMLPVVGIAQTYIIQTYRQWGKGDTIFLETISAEGSIRIPIPPQVADAIARQREALATKSRRKIGKAQAQDRKDKGIAPAFLRKKGPSK